MSKKLVVVARAAVLVAVVGAAAGCAGSASPSVAGSSTSGSSSDPMAGMDHGSSGTMGSMAGMDGMGAPIGDGTRSREFGFTLQTKTRPAGTGRQRLEFVVKGPDGSPVRDAAVEQTKKMHLIVVRSDLSGYQHVHPDLAADGTWSVDVDFVSAGRWRVIADVTPIVTGASTARLALGVDVDVPGSRPADTVLPTPTRMVSIDGFDIALDGTVRADAEQPVTFTITQGGAPAVGITEYLGAGGHLVALREGTLSYSHLHAEDPPGAELSFTASVPQSGHYRLFLQFATGETVHTAAFTIDVA